MMRQEDQQKQLALCEWLIGISARTLSTKKGSLTYVAPDWCRIECVRVPDDRVHKLIQTGKRGPNHIVACTGIPSLQMP